MLAKSFYPELMKSVVLFAGTLYIRHLKAAADKKK